MMPKYRDPQRAVSQVLLTATDAAPLLGCSPHTARALVAEGIIPSIPRGKRRRVSLAIIEEFNALRDALQACQQS